MRTLKKYDDSRRKELRLRWRFSQWETSQPSQNLAPNHPYVRYLNTWTLALLILCAIWIAAASVTLLAVPFGPLLILVGRSLWKQNWKTPKKVARMMDLPASVNQYPARVTFSSLDDTHHPFGAYPTVPLGSDEGLISFVEGNMYFQGTKSTFSIDSDRVDAKMAGSNLVGVFSDGEMMVGDDVPNHYTIAWQADGYKGVIGIRLFEASLRSRKDSCARFLKEYYKWLSPNPDPTQNIVLPPVGPEPQLLKEVTWAVRISNWLSTVFAVLFALSICIVRLPIGSVSLSLAVFGVWLMIFLFNRITSHRLNLMKRAQGIEATFWSAQEVVNRPLRPTTPAVASEELRSSSDKR